MTPFATYLAAEALHLSSILAVVAAGLYSGWRDPLRMDVAARQTTMDGVVGRALLAQWYWPSCCRGTAIPWRCSPASACFIRPRKSHAISCTAVAGAAILARLVWIFPSAYLPFLLVPGLRRRENPPTWQSVLAAGWAGMRGTITLAAALSIPHFQADGSPFPGRDIVIFLSLGVVLATLLIQGSTLGWFICWLRIPVDNTRVKEDRLARIAAVENGLKTLREFEEEATKPEEAAALGVVVAEYEHRLAELTAEGETKASAHRRRKSARHHRLRALRAERAAIDDLWRRDVIKAWIRTGLLQQLLDHEESMLDGQPEHVE